MNSYYLPIADMYCALKIEQIYFKMWPLIKFLKEKKGVNFNQKAYTLLDNQLIEKLIYSHHKNTYLYLFYVDTYTKSKNKNANTQIDISIEELQESILNLHEMCEAYNLVLTEFKQQKFILNQTLMPELYKIIAYKDYYWIRDYTYEKWEKTEASRRIEDKCFIEDYENPLVKIVKGWKKVTDKKLLLKNIEYVSSDIHQVVFNYAVYCEIKQEGIKSGFLGDNSSDTALFTLAEAHLFQTPKEAKEFLTQNEKIKNYVLIEVRPEINRIIEIFGEPIYFNAMYEKKQLNEKIHDTIKTLELAEKLMNVCEDSELQKALNSFIKKNHQKIDIKKTKL